MFLKENAKRKETEQRINGGPRHTYIFKCSITNCEKEIRVRSDALNTHSGKCNSHSHILRPYESIYNGLKNDHRKIQVELTYEEFIEFTNINNCHYCNLIIQRTEYSTVDKEFISRAYFLDRKDNFLGYSKDNCVVCCTRCNRMKSDKFTYEEFILLSPSLIEITKRRI